MTTVTELVERWQGIDQNFGRPSGRARQKELAAAEQRVIKSICAAAPRTLAECVPLLVMASHRATEMQSLAEDDDGARRAGAVRRDIVSAGELSSAVAHVLRFLAAETGADLDALGAPIFLFDHDHFPEYREAAGKTA